MNNQCRLARSWPECAFTRNKGSHTPNLVHREWYSKLGSTLVHCSVSRGHRSVSYAFIWFSSYIYISSSYTPRNQPSPYYLRRPSFLWLSGVVVAGVAWNRRVLVAYFCSSSYECVIIYICQMHVCCRNWRLAEHHHHHHHHVELMKH